MSRVAADLVCRSLLCFGMAAAIGGLVQSSSLAGFDAAPNDGQVVFGVVDDLGDLSASEVIPLAPGQQFGWRLAVEDQGMHTWREVLITPSAPREWIGADLTIVEQGRVGITERTEVAVGGALEHAWTITEGDPAGHHLIELWLDGRLVKRVSFVLVAPR